MEKTRGAVTHFEQEDGSSLPESCCFPWKRPASCSQRQGGGVEEEVEEGEVEDAVLVVVAGGGVGGDEDFGEGIVDAAEGTQLLLALFGGGESVGGLDVGAGAAEVADEIDLQLLALAHTALVAGVDGVDADIHGDAAAAQLVVDEVFHEVRFLKPAEVETGVAQTEVGEIVFGGGADVSFAADVVARGFFNQKSLFKNRQVFFDGSGGDFALFNRQKRVFQAGGVGEPADAGGDDIDQLLQIVIRADAVAFFDVGEVGVGENGVEVFDFVLTFGEEDDLRQPAVGQVVR